MVPWRVASRDERFGRCICRVSAADQTGSRPSEARVSRVILILVALATVAGLSYLTFTSGTKGVYVAAVDLPTYHQLTQADIRLMPVDRRPVPSGAAHESDRDTLLGRYITSAVRVKIGHFISAWSAHDCRSVQSSPRSLRSRGTPRRAWADDWPGAIGLTSYCRQMN